MSMSNATTVNVKVSGRGGGDDKPRVNHCCHCLLTFGTGGVWAPLWLAACCCGCPSLSDCPCGR